MRPELAIRIDGSNIDHHLWNNHGTWWIHYTVLTGGAWQRRVRHSLATRSVVEARELRDRIFAQLRAESDGGDSALAAVPRSRGSFAESRLEQGIAS